ncbi:MAG TPA: GNAT family protein [Stellaceae bacterium]|nr:GNAT family protein [Stellaceae bacterium]
MPADFLRLPRLLAGPAPFRLMGERVMARPPERGDWREWAELRSESRNFLVPWEPRWMPDQLTRAAFRRRLQRYNTDWRADLGYSFLLFRRADQALLGGIGLSNVRRGVAETGSLGYWVGERYARQGCMTEGLRLVLGFSFDHLRLHRVEAACLPHNVPSRTLLLHGGFREEGYARDYLCIDGRWQDHILFAILRSEWAARTTG